MYTITFRYGDKVMRLAVPESETLFSMLMIFDDSRRVVEYKVFQDDMILTPKKFGWGPFEKWVNKFDWSK